MGVFDRSIRFAVFTANQHPYKHTLTDFAYSNPSLPGVSNVESALDYMLAVLYPNTQPNVPTPADLPTGTDTPNPGDVTPTLNDYRVVDDDGDGKSAGYRYEQREGDVTGKWYKIFDVDWSTDAILAAVTDVTDDKYFFSKGKSDLDEFGNLVTGLYAGQKVYGGALANENLTLNANSGDGVGPQTGFVQIDSQFRPTLDNTYDLSTATERWKDGYFAGSVEIGTLSLSSASITDSSGSISFDNENLITTGNINGATITGTSIVADDTVNTVTLVPGSYTDSTGAVSFGVANLSTTGTLGAGVTTLTKGVETLVLDPDNGASRASIVSSLGAIDFGSNNLFTTGALDVGSLTSGLLVVDDIRLDGNTISTDTVNTSLNINPNGTGTINLQKLTNALDIVSTGFITSSNYIQADNIRLDGNTISSIDANGPLILDPNGTGTVQFNSNLLPFASGSYDVGSTTALLNDVYLSGGLRNASNEISIGTLLSLRSSRFRDLGQTQPAQNGDALFYDSVNDVWLASTPDSEVDHTTIANLTTGDAGHTQFVMLAGRAGGQVVQGGTAASENLTLESTSNASKGYVFTRDIFAPETNASFSATWSGTDIGDGTHYFRDVYTKGEFRGFRFENFTSVTLPAASAQNIGRTVYATDNNKAYIDTGTQFKVLGVSKYSLNQTFDGVQLVKDVTVSSEITDAREAQWQLLNNANNFEVMYVPIFALNATTVRIETNIPLPAGSYKLIGIE
jgi:hypothetical protein